MVGPTFERFKLIEYTNTPCGDQTITTTQISKVVTVGLTKFETFDKNGGNPSCAINVKAGPLKLTLEVPIQQIQWVLRPLFRSDVSKVGPTVDLKVGDAALECK